MTTKRWQDGDIEVTEETTGSGLSTKVVAIVIVLAILGVTMFVWASKQAEAAQLQAQASVQIAQINAQRDQQAQQLRAEQNAQVTGNVTMIGSIFLFAVMAIVALIGGLWMLDNSQDRRQRRLLEYRLALIEQTKQVIATQRGLEIGNPHARIPQLLER